MDGWKIHFRPLGPFRPIFRGFCILKIHFLLGPFRPIFRGELAPIGFRGRVYIWVYLMITTPNYWNYWCHRSDLPTKLYIYYPKNPRLDPPMEGWMNLHGRGVFLGPQNSQFWGVRILRVGWGQFIKRSVTEEIYISFTLGVSLATPKPDDLPAPSKVEDWAVILRILG